MCSFMAKVTTRVTWHNSADFKEKNLLIAAVGIMASLLYIS